MTAVLAPALWRASGNIVIVSSGGMYAQRFDLDRLEMKADGYDGVVAYARAKRAQVVMADAWATRFAPAGVAGYSTHPGWVDTPGLQAGLPRFRALWRPLLRRPAQGADTVVWLAAGGARIGVSSGRGAQDGEGGRHTAGARAGFFHDRRARPTRRLPVLNPTHPGDPGALLAWCAARTGTETLRPHV